MTDAPDRDTLTSILEGIGEDLPPAVEVAERLADALELSVSAAQDRVEAALDAGVLVEEDVGAFGGVRLADGVAESDESADTEDQRGAEAGSGDANPTLDAEGSVSEAVTYDEAQAALRDILEFYHSHVDDTIDDHTDGGDRPDRPTTARAYFTEGRGWSDAVVDDLRLGWAPPDHVDQLVAYLHRRGHSREAMLATGLIGEGDDGGLYATFPARYVLPYYGAGGKPLYAIARTTGSKGGGAAGYDGHPRDWQAGKYAKVRHTDDRVPFSEPIWGLDTLAAGEPVVVAEGVADAVRARQAGHAVLSPVAKEFKRDHIEPLRDALTDHDVPAVYIVPDSEAASFAEPEDAPADPESIGDALDMPAVPAGLGGSLRTAALLEGALEDADIDDTPTVQVAHLPRAGLRKVDLDDFLGTWTDDLEGVLASAKPARAFREFGKATRNMVAWGKVSSGSYASSGDGRPTGDHADHADRGDGVDPADPNRSSLWALDIGDVTPAGLSSAGDRGRNHAGHSGNSESYFVLREGREGDLVASDYKGDGQKASYNALTYLLVDAGVRDRDAPEGSLSDAEVWTAWRHARENDHLPLVELADGSVTTADAAARADRDGELLPDPIPLRALWHIAREDDVVEAAVPDDYDDGRLPTEAREAVLAHVREEHGVDPGREVPDGSSDGGDDGEEYRTDPRRVEATVDPRRAWEAAGRVEPAELDQPLPLEHTDDREAWLADGHRVDIVRAVAVAEGLAEAASDPITDGYPEAYQLARDRYGAPLPAYYTTTDAIAEFDAVLDVAGELTFWDLDVDALDSDVTERGDEVGGAAVRSLDPAWRESDSGASVLVFESGNVWDADTDTTLSPLRFVALDAGVFCHPRESWDDGEFSTAYQLARERYGAPLPRWEPAAGGERAHTAQLPEPDDLADTRPFNGVNADALDEAREDVEGLLNDAMTGGDTPTVVRALPATGKTTGAVKNAGGAVEGTGIPSSYLSPRKELQKQALEKADRWGADARILPVFSDDSVVDEILAGAVSHVREAGKQRLRDRWAVLAAAADASDEEDLDDLELFEGGDEDEDNVELDRATCETADGLHGPAWALVVHVARRLGYTPREIHTQARGLFGAPLPCMCDENGTDVSNVEGEGCRYSLGWSDVADPDDPADLLVGSYVHAHVESVRTFYERDGDGDVRKRSRAVVVDEFPGEAFGTEYGEEALDFATWLAGCLQDDVDDRRDMYESDLGADGWVSAWLDGDGDDYDAVRPLADALSRCGDLLDAREAAADIRDSVGPSILDTFDLAAPLSGVSSGTPAAALEDLKEALDSIRSDQRGASLARMVDDEVAAPLRRATSGDSDVRAGADIDAAPIGGDLARLVKRGLEALDADTDSGREAVQAATTALRGGREGCRRLAAWADDGYAHPDAHHFLNAVVTPTDDDADDPGARRIDTDGWAFDPDATDGTVLDVVDTGERARVLLDRNDHGAVLHTPPGREAGNGELAPLVGLDATARRDLWATALLEDVVVEDIHDTDAERAAFLEEALDLRVLQAAERPRPYEGDPATKDTDGDVALLEALADEYSGIAAPRGRDDDPTTIGKPAAVTTDCVRSLLESDDRLKDVVAAWENYGNLTGSNELGGHRLAAVLGCQHYGDDAVERFAALAGESVDTDRRDGRGADLAYGSGVADEYLAHMQEDQTMQAVLRFARGGSGATVVARTSALRDDLPVVGRAQVVETWSDTAASIAGAYRRLDGRFTAADIGGAVDVSTRHVRRVLAELVEAGYLRHVGGGDGTAKVYESAGAPGAGEVKLPDRSNAVANGAAAGRGATKEYYTWNVRVEEAGSYLHDAETGVRAAPRGAPPAPGGEAAGPPPG